jgi:predicted Zn-dependent peptidase
LFWELVDNGLAESAVAFTQEFEECGLFCTYMACTPEARSGNWQRLEDVLRSGKAKPIQDREIELAKNKICSGMILSSERPGNRLFTIGNAWLNREKYETVAQATQNYQRVTKDELQATFERLADRKNITVSVVPEA